MIAGHRIRAFLLRHLFEIKASIDRKADIVFFPVIDILIFGLLTVYIDKFDVKAGLAAGILGGIILWTLVYNIVRDISFSLLEDTWSRNLYNLYSTPLSVSEIVIATLILSVIKAAITIAILVALAFGLFHFNLFALGWVVVFYIFNIFIFGWAFGFATSSLILRYGQKVQAMAWSLVLVIYPLSGVFYPLSVLPPVLGAIAKFFPLAYIFEGLRTVILAGQIPEAGDFITITVLSVVYLAVGIWLFVVGFRHAKARGWFIHPS